MEVEEWLNALKGLSVDHKVEVHFELQNQIKYHYHLRDKDDHLQRAIQLCEQSVVFSKLALPALKKKWLRDFPGQDFYAPAHHGYRQLISIMKKQKNLRRVEELERKRGREGWAK